MDLEVQTSRTYNGHPVAPGVPIPVDCPVRLEVALVVICDDIGANRWHGEARFDGHTLIRTETAASADRAATDVRARMSARILKLLSGQ